MRRVAVIMLGLGAVAGCTLPVAEMPGQPGASAPESGQIRPVARRERPEHALRPVSSAARTVEEFDTTTSEERAAAVATAAPAQALLGMTVASLGSPSEPGFWLKTPLVSAPAKGRVVYPGTGKSVAVDLIPIDGPSTAGSRMSLSAMRLIEAPLTGLPEVEVYRAGG